MVIALYAKMPEVFDLLYILLLILSPFGIVRVFLSNKEIYCIVSKSEFDGALDFGSLWFAL